MTGEDVIAFEVRDLDHSRRSPALDDDDLTELYGVGTHTSDMLLAHVVASLEMELAARLVEDINRTAAPLRHGASLLEHGLQNG